MNPDEEEPKPEGDAAPDAPAPDEREAAPEMAEARATDEPEPEIAAEPPAPETVEPPALEPAELTSFEAEPELAPVAEEINEPPQRIHEVAAPDLHEEPLAEIEPTYARGLERAPEPVPEPEPAPDDEYLFGEPEIPMPELRRSGDLQRRRDAKRNLDLDLGRIKRRKRYGLFITTISVLFIAFVLAPVTWTAAYLFFDPPSTVLMMQRAAEGQTIRHYPVPLNRMSPHIVRAVIAAEDANFCTHDGFDIEAIQDAMAANERGDRTRGASTISQQTAKNLFLWPDRSWLRKGFETYFTALLEFMWPKRRVMEAYLNAAEWGDGNFGIEAAARSRFGVSAADLSPLQAARLAAVLPSPNRWRADNPGPYVRRRAASIVERARVVRNEGMAGCALILDRRDTQ